jgi:O-acetyl-ADP-ribose deacetylase (regulator of RNase III)
VDGAIHRAAGAELYDECLKANGCPTGHAKVTKGYRLPAKHIIHTVGPVYENGLQGEAQALASCYRRSMQLATELGARTVAFPAISTGVYGYPLREAQEIAVKTIAAHPAPLPELVILCTFDDETTAVTREMVSSVLAYA